MVVAAAVTDAAERPVAAIHIAGSLAEWDARGFQLRMGPPVIEAARSISA